MNSLTFIKTSIAICEEQKASGLRVYDVRENSDIADFCLICSGNSLTHIRALSQHISKKFKDSGVLPRNVEGTPASQWILMDYSDVIIHLFVQEIRDYYTIESLFDESHLFYSDK